VGSTSHLHTIILHTTRALASTFNLYIKFCAHEHAQTTTILVSEEKTVNKIEEKKEQTKHPPNPNVSNDKEVSTEAHSFITIPLETFHEPQVSFIQCLKEPFYAKTFKDLCKQAGKPRNHRPKKILLSNKIGCIRW
jgi:hypothetical protein